MDVIGIVVSADTKATFRKNMACPLLLIELSDRPKCHQRDYLVANVALPMLCCPFVVLALASAVTLTASNV